MKRKKLRKFNVEFSLGNPFDRHAMSLDDMEWDWIFEEEEFYVKEQTLSKYDDMLEQIVKNRSIVDDSCKVLLIDVPNSIINKYDNLLIHYIQGWFVRMVKTSKCIQTLSVSGNYVESKALLRLNIEKSIMIHYFTGYPDKLRKYLELKKADSRKAARKFSIKTMADKIGENYDKYAYLSRFIHSNLFDVDISMFSIADENWTQIQSFNSVDLLEFLKISESNNNVLIESFNAINSYLLSSLSEKKIKELGYSEIMSRIKKLAYLKIEEN